MSKCLVITTGGTIDKDVTLPRGVTSIHHSHVPDAVKELGLSEKCEFMSWRMRSSNAFMKRDMKELADIISHSDASHIIVTHGTDCMAENSRVLSDIMKQTDKTVIFTGALVPLTAGRHSDGYENLLLAIEEGAMRSPGVHVMMNGQWFEPERLHKDYGNDSFYTAKQEGGFVERITGAFTGIFNSLVGMQK